MDDLTQQLIMAIINHHVCLPYWFPYLYSFCRFHRFVFKIILDDVCLKILHQMIVVAFLIIYIYSVLFFSYLFFFCKQKNDIMFPQTNVFSILLRINSFLFKNQKALMISLMLESNQLFTNYNTLYWYFFLRFMQFIYLFHPYTQSLRLII